MKTKITVLFTLLSASAFLFAGPTTKRSSAEIKLEAHAAIQKQVLAQITPPDSLRLRFSRAIAMPALSHEVQFTDAKGAASGRLNFAIIERHRPPFINPNAKPKGKGQNPKHPRDGVTVLAGYYDTATGAVFLLDAKSKKHITAAEHPQVRASKVKAT